MPHATDDMMEDADREAAAVNDFLSGAEVPVNIDQSNKAADAIDYEDFSDDELPEEEEATNTAGANDDEEDLSAYYNTAPPAIGGLPAPATTNGYGDEDVKQPTINDLFGDGDPDGDGDGDNDLFGDLVDGSASYSSPEEVRQPPSQQPRLGGLALALPSKSGLALPNSFSQLPQSRAPMHPSPLSMSPPAFPDQDYSGMSPGSMTSDDDDDTGLDPETALQRRLFKDSRRRNAGEDVLAGPVNTDMTLFHTLYPGYEQTHIPKFIELFPGYNVEYKGKVPVKPPKAVQPHKLTLDLLQDQERSFRSITTTGKAGQESTFNNSFVRLGYSNMAKEDSDDDHDSSVFDEDERIGGISMQDLALICQDWDAASIDAISTIDELEDRVMSRRDGDRDWEADNDQRPMKKRRTDGSCLDITGSYHDSNLSFEDPERAVAKLAKTVFLDLNDPNLLIDEHAPRTKRKPKRMPGDFKRDTALSRDIAKRYNISNDQAYDLLKENHQHKVRSTLGSMAIEHSFPATKLQYPFYQVSLENKAKRNFHRPQLELRAPSGKEYRFQRPKHIKRKNVRGKDAKEVFAKAEDLSLGDSASLLMLEYSEEAPMMLSNFGMGNRLINYYRKKDADDSTRPKLEIGEAQVLLTQDKSPFANFGHVDKGDTVPTIQNGLFRAPVFSHDSKAVDFVIGISSTHEGGDRFFLRNVENLHTVGQQFPLAEVPGQHSRKVTDAAKKRLRALAFRIYLKSRTRKDKVLDNRTLMPHLPGHDMPQTRSKMREFMKYERLANKGENGGGVWVPVPQHPVPDLETLRSWIKPEDVCLLDSMQVGVQHLSDLGITETKDAEEQDGDETSNNIELQLIPWRATKNFLNACQGKAMLTLHGEGDPTNRGEGFSFVKTSMKGGFQAPGESVNDKIFSKNKKESGGHSYNVAKQQKAYDDYIRRIWEAQKDSLTNTQEFSDDDMEDARDGEGEHAYSRSRAQTPRSSFGGPAANRHDDEVSQFSGHSAGQVDKPLVITRKGGVDENGKPRADAQEIITNPAVIKEYRKRQLAKQLNNVSMDTYVPTGNSEQDTYKKQFLEKELMRIKRNAERREARERLKAKNGMGVSPAAAGSPGPSEVDGPSSNPTANADSTPQKGKGRSKDGTQRKCANCGLVGHIKTNRKLCPKLNGTQSAEDGGANGDSSFGAAPAPLTL